MSDTKYISVIHKKTQKIVSAFQFENDVTWIGRDKEDLLATSIYCEPGQKIKMCFVKSYPKLSGKKVYAYFRAMPGEPTPKAGMSGESSSHRKAKENIYAGLYSGEIKINGESIDLNLVKNIIVEYRTSATEYVIPDVIVLFKDIHPKFGLGLFFEIQLSEQKAEETIVRTYRRVIEGLSGAWLGLDDFNSEWKFNKDNIEIASHRKLLMNLEFIQENNFIKKINKYGEAIDRKINEYENDVLNISVESIKNVEDDFKSYKKEIKEVAEAEISKIEFENSQLKELKEVASKLNLEELQERVKNINFELNDFGVQLLNELKNEINKNKKEVEETFEKIRELENKGKALDLHITKKVESIINSSVNLGIIFDRITPRKCPKCNRDMKLGKGIPLDGVNWYCKPDCGGFLSGDKEYD